jgi:iron(III) transport system ATP-binding protein
MDTEVAGFVSVRGLRKKFGSVWAVDDVSFDVDEGKLLVLLGPSGCGKTTTLRCIGGLERPDGGQIIIDGVEVTNAAKGLYLQPEARGMGMVAQSYAIWPHMSVFENVAFPLRMRKERTSVIGDRVRSALEVVRLEGLGSRNATDLSGGQQQRVALARAIVARPKVLLFDEPLSNLDAKLREQMRYLLKDIQKEIKITAVYVTHDQSEAMGLADELIVMNGGRIEQRGDARSLYCDPMTRFVAEFIGVANVLEGSLVEAASDKDTVSVRLGDAAGTVLRCRRGAHLSSNNVAILVRPEWITVRIDQPRDLENAISGTVLSSQYLGERTELIVRTQFKDMRVTASGSVDYVDGMKASLVIDGTKCVALPAAAQRSSHAPNE